ncbi:hypothetical protein [Mobiluncus sp.]|uniref:hypothetical protein n=1 Tax=Mobiluncus sp. TaxID=47293 RepID=UPI002A9208C3|nr:hypothetical protein [Mobiluncus sp.]MDY6077108.1 hypothetical protein [Mobiluncus sp.]
MLDDIVKYILDSLVIFVLVGILVFVLAMQSLVVNLFAYFQSSTASPSRLATASRSMAIAGKSRISAC